LIASDAPVHRGTLPYSPYQNAKQEAFWGPVEGRLMAMFEGVPDLTTGSIRLTIFPGQDSSGRTHTPKQSPSRASQGTLALYGLYHRFKRLQCDAPLTSVQQPFKKQASRLGRSRRAPLPGTCRRRTSSCTIQHWPPE
jgi:hypothetical protein